MHQLEVQPRLGRNGEIALPCKCSPRCSSATPGNRSDGRTLAAAGQRADNRAKRGAAARSNASSFPAAFALFFKRTCLNRIFLSMQSN